MRTKKATANPKLASRENGDLKLGSGIPSLPQFHRQKQAGPVSLARFGLVAELEGRPPTSQTRYRHDQQRHGCFVADAVGGASVEDVAAGPVAIGRHCNAIALPRPGPSGNFRLRDT